MVDIFDELKEEAQEEKWLNIWKKYQNHLYGVMILCVALTAGNVFWKRHQRSKALEASEKYISALHSIDGKHAKTAVGLLEEIPLKENGAYKDLSRFLVGSLLQDEGDDEGAREVYRGIVNDAASGSPYRNLALLRLAYLGFDSEDPKALLGLLEGLTKKGNPWRYSALELTALLHMKLGNADTAKTHLTTLLEDAKAEETAPQFVIFRAESLLRSLHRDQRETSKK